MSYCLRLADEQQFINSKVQGYDHQNPSYKCTAQPVVAWIERGKHVANDYQYRVSVSAMHKLLTEIELVYCTGIAQDQRSHSLANC